MRSLQFLFFFFLSCLCSFLSTFFFSLFVSLHFFFPLILSFFLSFLSSFNTNYLFLAPETVSCELNVYRVLFHKPHLVYKTAIRSFSEKGFATGWGGLRRKGARADHLAASYLVTPPSLKQSKRKVWFPQS